MCEFNTLIIIVLDPPDPPPPALSDFVWILSSELEVELRRTRHGAVK